MKEILDTDNALRGKQISPEYFPFNVLCNSVDAWRQRPKDSVRANGGHFE